VNDVLHRVRELRARARVGRGRRGRKYGHRENKVAPIHPAVKVIDVGCGIGSGGRRIEVIGGTRESRGPDDGQGACGADGHGYA
jgi:hypothetical protein